MNQPINVDTNKQCTHKGDSSARWIVWKRSCFGVVPPLHFTSPLSPTSRVDILRVIQRVLSDAHSLGIRHIYLRSPLLAYYQ